MTGFLSRAVALLAAVAVTQAATATTKPSKGPSPTGIAPEPCKSILQIGKDHADQFSTLLKLVKAAGLDKALGNKSMLLHMSSDFQVGYFRYPIFTTAQ